MFPRGFTASVEKRSGAYRVKYRDPLGRQPSRSFAPKLEADRFAREVEVEKDRGAWLNPRDAEMAVGEWAAEFDGAVGLLLRGHIAHPSSGGERSATPPVAQHRWPLRVSAFRYVRVTGVLTLSRVRVKVNERRRSFAARAHACHRLHVAM